jgi:hypothetical protein
MRKLFHMKYEPCNGDCYAECAVVDLYSMKLARSETAEFFRRLLAIHLPACGNTNLMFRVDVDEPISLMRSEGLQFDITPRERFEIAYCGERRKIDQIRVEITLEGDSCILGALQPSTELAH